MDKDIQQIKLVSGNELLCEVVEWPDEKSDNSTDLIIRNALSIINGENEEGNTVFLFKPFLHYVDKSSQFVSLSKMQIMSLNRPDRYLQKEYMSAFAEFEKSSFERDLDYKEQEMYEVSMVEEALEETKIDDKTDNVVQLNTKTLH